MTPIIYIRGYAGTSSAVESAVDSPYYGFNDGSSRIRVNGRGDPEMHLFESPLIRLMREHGFSDVFVRVRAGKVEVLKSNPDADFPPGTIWIFRYYDETSTSLGSGKRKTIEELADDLAVLVDFVRKRTGAAKVDLVAHSMGGLVARSLIQRKWKSDAEKKIRRFFTYGTPHRGIHFRGGLGWAEWVRDLAGVNESDTFGLKRMRQFLNLPSAKEENLNELGSGTSFSPEQCFSLIGTNHHDYELTVSRSAVGPGSDGLVMCQHAYIKGSNRAYVHRAHSGPYGLVNSEEGYQNLQRFLFGDTAVKVSLRGLMMDTAQLRASRGARLQRVLIESKAALRNVGGYLHYQQKEFGSHLSLRPSDLRGGEALFRIFLMKSKRSDSKDQWSRFQIEIALRPLFNRVLGLGEFEGDFLFRRTLEIGVRDPNRDGSRDVEWSWNSLNQTELKSIRLPKPTGIHRIDLPTKDTALTGGRLEFEVSEWN
jgi:pimeloyl-ACP methyl ester carboxylesterase